MSILILILVAILWFLWGFLKYASRIERELEVNPDEPTPAYTRQDGVDYMPAKHWIVLFGHHFASIAGAAPIIGPVIAVGLWGWGPGILWVLLGSVLMGGVHDFSSLMVSVKEGGRSIADIAGESVSKRASLFFSIFVFLALILVISVFAFFCAKTFTQDPHIVLPSLGLIPIAVLVGISIYRWNWNQVLSTIVGLVLLALLILLGRRFPIAAGVKVWIIVLLIYAFFASITPVNILLQPRDYLASYLLFLGLFFGYLGLVLSHPAIRLPVYIGWTGKGGWLWPMMFVTIACGAISGFHSLIASGTTSKQLPNQGYARRIGYGAMLMEGIVSVMAIAVVITGFNTLSGYRDQIAQAGPIGVFGRGYGAVTEIILGAFGGLMAITVLNAFILTTLDTATRISRYILEELTGMKNKFLSTGIVVIIALWLVWGGKWQLLWPAFGASNQLVAALALFTVSCWLLRKGRMIRYTIVPACIMFITTVFALGWQITRYIKGLPKVNNIILIIISSILIVLAIYMFAESLRTIRKLIRTTK